jgi:membrane dipeptidase
MSSTMPLLPHRRSLILGTLAGVAASGLARAAEPAQKLDFDRVVVVNTLGGLENPNAPPTAEEEKSQVIVRLSPHSIDAQAIADLHASGTTAVNITVGHVSGSADPFEYTVAEIGRWQTWLREHPADFMPVFRAQDILQAKAQKKIGLIFGFQNALMLGDKPERVDLFGDLGVRIVQLTYNPANQIGDGSTASANHGLSAIGRQMVERLNQRRLLMDLSHSGQNTCLDAARAS